MIWLEHQECQTFFLKTKDMFDLITSMGNMFAKEVWSTLSLKFKRQTPQKRIYFSNI